MPRARVAAGHTPVRVPPRRASRARHPDARAGGEAATGRIPHAVATPPPRRRQGEPQAGLSPVPCGGARLAGEAPASFGGSASPGTASGDEARRALGDGLRLRGHQRRPPLPHPDAHRHLHAPSTRRRHRAKHRGPRVVRFVEQVAATHGYPRSITVDNGPEFVSNALDQWAHAHGSSFTSAGRESRSTMRSSRASTAGYATSASTRTGSTAWSRRATSSAPGSRTTTSTGPTARLPGSRQWSTKSNFGHRGRTEEGGHVPSGHGNRRHG